jgi:Predicted membrane protein
MGNDAQGAETHVTPDVDFAAIQQTERFAGLRRRHRSFVFPVLALALVWYLAYVLLAGYAPEFMATPVFGRVNIGLLIGLGQVATTFIITMLYVAFANRSLDPVATQIREEGR